MMNKSNFLVSMCLLLFLLANQLTAQVNIVQEPKPEDTEAWEPEPKQLHFSESDNIPSDAIILFDGSNKNAWEDFEGNAAKWKMENNVLQVVPGTGNIRSKEKFGDCQLHIEWMSPEEPNKSGQDKGNSGVFFQERYEVQILNSFENRTYSNGQATAIYKQHIPLVNATKPTGQWNVYDIVFKAPKFNAVGGLEEHGRITVLHNGVLVQNNVKIYGSVAYIGPPKMEAHGDGHIVLQDHSNEVSFRNIWLRKL